MTVEGAAFIPICCDWTKTALIFFRFTNTVCHVVRYVCLLQQFKGWFGQYKPVFSDESAEILLLRLEK